MTTYGAGSRQPLKLGGKVIEYGTTRRLKDGTVVYEFTPPREPGTKYQGPQVMKGITTATDARNEIDRLKPLYRTGRIGDTSATLGPVYKDCLAAMKDGSFKHSEGTYTQRSIELFEQRAEQHVLGDLGRGTKIVDIKAAHLRLLMQKLEAKGLGGSAVRGCISCAGTILRYAVGQAIVERNEANLIGRGERPSAKRKSEPRYLAVAEINQLLEKVTDETSKAVVASMFWGALRVSEALELRWKDILGDGTLLVRGTKTKGSWGIIPLLPQLAAVLQAHRERMGRLGFDRIQPEALIFQTSNGTAFGRRNILRSVQAAGDAAKLNPKPVEGVEPVAPIGCHDMRHSMAALALVIFQGDMVKTAKLLRHANPGVTATIYAGRVDSGAGELGAELTAGLGG